jgi:hypothetical protein
VVDEYEEERDGPQTVEPPNSIIGDWHPIDPLAFIPKTYE